MYCRVCGKYLDSNKSICPYCGSKISEDKISGSNNYAIAAIIFAFIMPLLGLIFGIEGYSKSKKMNGEGKAMSRAAIVFSSFIIGLCILAIPLAFIP